MVHLRFFRVLFCGEFSSVLTFSFCCPNSVCQLFKLTHILSVTMVNSGLLFQVDLIPVQRCPNRSQFIALLVFLHLSNFSHSVTLCPVKTTLNSEHHFCSGSWLFLLVRLLPDSNTYLSSKVRALYSPIFLPALRPKFPEFHSAWLLSFVRQERSI